jgi:hypothetical protein
MVQGQNVLHPVAGDWIPYILDFGTLEAWIWRPGGLDAGRVGVD